LVTPVILAIQKAKIIRRIMVRGQSRQKYVSETPHLKKTR
jgi:hypothetical protein